MEKNKVIKNSWSSQYQASHPWTVKNLCVSRLKSQFNPHQIGVDGIDLSPWVGPPMILGQYDACPVRMIINGRDQSQPLFIFHATGTRNRHI